MRVMACRCEKIPEREFDAHPDMHEGWEELCRKDGYVYIGYLPPGLQATAASKEVGSGEAEKAAAPEPHR